MAKILAVGWSVENATGSQTSRFLHLPPGNKPGIVMAHPYLEELRQLLHNVGLEDSDIVCKHFFSGAAGYTAGKIFTSLTPKGLAVKLPESRCEKLLSNNLAEPLRYFDKSPVKRGYVLFPAYEDMKKSELKQYFLESKTAIEQDET